MFYMCKIDVVDPIRIVNAPVHLTHLQSKIAISQSLNINFKGQPDLSNHKCFALNIEYN